MSRTSQLQEREKALKQRVQGYGQNLPVLLAKYDTRYAIRGKRPKLACRRMGKLGLEQFLETWPRSGMTVNGIAYQLPPLAQNTGEIGFGYWPTITATGNQLAPAMQERYANPIYPTPTSKEGGYNRSPNSDKKRPTLSTMARKNLWPTPQARDWKNVGSKESQLKQMEKRNSPSLALTLQTESQTTGQLSPLWVEWLMGYPIGWTGLED